MRIRSQKDFASGLMFILVGLGFSFVARGYSMGTAAKICLLYTSDAADE